MNLENLIYKRLSEAKDLTKHLTTFGGKPAVFTPEAPGDRAAGWGTATQYPRIVFNFDMQTDGERKSAGTLLVSLICRNDSDAVPELIEPAVRECLKDVLLKDDSNTLIDQILSYLNEKGEYVPQKDSTFTPALCNRLDRNTSGIVIAGKNSDAVRQLICKYKYEKNNAKR